MNPYRSETESPRWRPDSRFIKFPSDREVSIDWHKLASIDLHDLLKGRCDVDTLQEHLNHIAFCQPQKEIMITTSSGQRNMLKIFRLSQLIIQYLFLSQEVLETKLNKAVQDHKTITEKYNEAKSKLSKQFEESKKLKQSNRNLTETTAHLHNLLSSIGAIEYFRCSSCSKAFRSKDFLLSHLQRKHPNKVSMINLDDCRVSSQTASDESLIADNLLGHRHPKSNREVPNHTHKIRDQSKPRTFSHVHKEPPSKENLLQDSCSKSPNDATRTYHYDIDAIKMKEMENNLIDMRTLVLKLSKDVEYQNNQIETEKNKRRIELCQLENEKQEIRNDYEKTLKDLSDKIIFLQSDNNEEDSEGANISEIIAIQKTEIEHLRSKLNERSKRTKKVETLEKEVSKMKDFIKVNEKKQEEKMKAVSRTLQQKYDQNLMIKKENFQKQIDELNSRPVVIAIPPVTVKKPPPVAPRRTLPIPNLETKPTLVTPNEENVTIQNIVEPSLSPQLKLRTDEVKIHKMIDSDSETETSKWYEEKSASEESIYSSHFMKRKEIPAAISTDSDIPAAISTDSDIPAAISPDSDHSYSEEINSLSSTDSQIYPIATTNPRQDLQVLQVENSTTWQQMKDSVESELEDRFERTFELNSHQRIDKNTLQSCLQKLRSKRNLLEGDRKDFFLIRKSLENKIDAEMLSKSKEDKFIIPNTRKSTRGFLRSSLKKIGKNVVNKTKAISSALKPSTTINENRPTIISVAKTRESSEISEIPDEVRDTSDTESITNSVEQEQHIVDVHNETSHSIQRNLFQSSPLMLMSKNTTLSRPTLYANYQNHNVDDQWSSSDYDDNTPSPPRSEDESEESDKETYLNIIANDIKLKKPSGENVKQLSQMIEKQLRERGKEKPAGAVDVTGKSDEQIILSDQSDDYLFAS